MAQLGKGKLNYRCPLCFMRDLDIDMFYNKETGIYSCIRCKFRGTEEEVLLGQRGCPQEVQGYVQEIRQVRF